MLKNSFKYDLCGRFCLRGWFFGLFHVLWALFILLMLVFSMSTEAQKKKRKMKKRVVIDFQDELLEGNVSNPSIFHLFHKKQIDYGRLVKFRKNFLPEMRRTAREIEP